MVVVGGCSLVWSQPPLFAERVDGWGGKKFSLILCCCSLCNTPWVGQCTVLVHGLASLVELGTHKAIFYNCLDLDITLCCAGAVLVLCLQTVNTTAIFN